MIQRWKVTFTDGLGPDGAHKGTVLRMPGDWIHARVQHEICSWADEQLGNKPGTSYLIPEFVQSVDRAAIYDDSGMTAALLIAIDYAGSAYGVEVRTAGEEGTADPPRLSQLYHFPFPGMG